MKNVGIDSRTDDRSRYNVLKMDDIGERVTSGKFIKREGSIMLIATRDVVTIPPTMTIKGAIDTMNRYRFRRLPVCEPGRNRLIGIVTSRDIINFLGGGEKARIIAVKHSGNFLAGINESVMEIIEPAVFVSEESSIKDGIETMFKSKTDYVIVVNNDEERIIRGIISERDFVELLYEKITGKYVKDFMSRNVVYVDESSTLKDVVLTMIRKRFRRVPVINSQGIPIGIVTTRTIINLISSNNIFKKLINNRLEDVLNINVREFMRRDIVKIGEDEDLGKAAKLMIENKTGGLLVTNEEKITGIITEHDLLRAIWRDMSESY